MLLLKTKNDLQTCLQNHELIGFVPTMGALHDGHLALIKRSKAENALTVCSIFVNPTQFNQASDFQHYPVTIEKDLEKLCGADCNVLFLPSVAEMYPRGITQLQEYDLGALDEILEGKFRPGHFKGVCNIVDKLLRVVQPQNLYMGEKDYQQCMVIKKLLQLNASTVQLSICPTLREEDGLAMSSRNLRLSADERRKAPLLYATICRIRDERNHSPFNELAEQAIDELTKNGFTTEYLALADAQDLTLLHDFDPKRKMVILIASALGQIRLIDNLSI